MATWRAGREFQDTVAIGSAAFDLNVKVGQSVTFAVEKKSAYIKLDGGEYRLRVLKSERKNRRDEAHESHDSSRRYD